MSRALQEYRAGHYEFAQQVLTQVITISPESAPAHNLLGLVWMQEHRYLQAESEFNLALRFQPESPSANVNLGNALVQEGRDDKAQVQYKKALSIRANDPIALLNLGLIYARAHRDDDAAQTLKAAHDVEPGNAEIDSALAGTYIDMMRFADAKAILEPALQAGSLSDRALFSLASLALEKGDPKLGLRCVEGNLSLRSEYETLTYQTAATLVESHKYDDALKILQAVPLAGPMGAEYHVLLGTIYYRRDEPQPAVSELQEAIRLDPQNPEYYYTLAMMFLKHRTADGAILVFHSALKNAPNTAKLWMGLGLSYYILGDTRNAREKLDKAIEVDAGYGPAYIVLCDLLSQTGHDQELIDIIPKAIEMEPKNYLLPYYYGKSLARENKAGAESQFRKSIALDPQFADAYFELGKELDSGGKSEEAEASLTKCLRLDPNMVEADYLLSRLYHKLGKEYLASKHLKAFQKSRQEDGEDEKIQRLLFTVED